MNTRMLFSGLVTAALLVGSGALATDRAMASRPVTSLIAADGPAEVETISIEILSGEGSLWTGNLRIGGKYGNASFSQSTSEYAAPCPGKPFAENASKTVNYQIRLNLSRRNWQQTPNSFNVNVNWVRPLSPCEGEGTNTLGFTRVVDIPRGKTVRLQGTGGLVVRLTR